MQKLIIISISILTILSCCKKDDLKPEDYKFYCKVNGVEWKRTTEGGFCPGCSPLLSDYYASEKPWNPKGLLEIIANRTIESKGIRQVIQLVVWGGLKEGQNNISKRFVYTDYNSLCGRNEGHSLDTNYMNTFIISKLDTIEKQIVGNFDLRVIDKKCTPPDTIRITEGHFNLRPTWHP